MLSKINSCLNFLGLKPKIVDGLFEIDSGIEIKDTKFMFQNQCFNCEIDNVEKDNYDLFNEQTSIDNFNTLHHTVPSKFHYNLIKNCVFDKQNVLQEHGVKKSLLTDEAIYPKLEIEETNKNLLVKNRDLESKISQLEEKSFEICKDHMNLIAENSIIKNDLHYHKMLNEKLTETNGNLLSLVQDLYSNSICTIQEKPLKTAFSSDSQCANKRNRDTLYESSWPNAPPKNNCFCELTNKSFKPMENNKFITLKNDLVNFNEKLVYLKIKQFKMISQYEVADDISLSTFLEQFQKENFSMCSQQEYCSIIHQFLGKKFKAKMGEMGDIHQKTDYEEYLYQLCNLVVGYNVSELDVLSNLKNLKMKGYNLLEKYERIVSLVDDIHQDVWPEKFKCHYIYHYCKKYMEKSLKPVFDLLHKIFLEDC